MYVVTTVPQQEPFYTVRNTVKSTVLGLVRITVRCTIRGILRITVNGMVRNTVKGAGKGMVRIRVKGGECFNMSFIVTTELFSTPYNSGIHILLPGGQD